MNAGDSKTIGPKTNGTFMTIFRHVAGANFCTISTLGAVLTTGFRSFTRIGQILTHGTPKTSVGRDDTNAFRIPARLFWTTPDFGQFQRRGRKTGCVEFAAHTMHPIDGR